MLLLTTYVLGIATLSALMGQSLRRANYRPEKPESLILFLLTWPVSLPAVMVCLLVAFVVGVGLGKGPIDTLKWFNGEDEDE